MQSNALNDVTVFQSIDNIPQKIDAIDFVASYSSFTYSKFLTLGVDKNMARSIKALIIRSNFINKNNWLSRRGIKLIASCFKKAHWLSSIYYRRS
jgi:predicted CoA-binding protein